jgi:protein-S-isoprenylcysteine O-methyltransferase Ste14
MNSALLGMICFGNGVIILTFYTIANNRLRKLSIDAFWLGGGILGGLGMVSFGAAWVLLAFSGPYYYLPLLQIVGGVLVVLAGLLCFWAMIYVGRLRPRKDFSLTLSTQGPYRHVRHPQALAFCGLTLGLGLMTLSQPFLFGFPLWIGFWVLYAHLEEQFELIPSYGSPYQQYCQATPRLLPALKDWKPFLLQGKMFFECLIKSRLTAR